MTFTVEPVYKVPSAISSHADESLAVWDAETILTNVDGIEYVVASPGAARYTTAIKILLPQRSVRPGTW